MDTLRADRIGAYGYEPALTPTMDDVAAAGVRFAEAVSPAPLTLVSHATLLTGLDPPEHGVHHNGIFQLPEDVPTLAAHAREAGFSTAAFVGAFVLDDRFGLARGFDHYDDGTVRPASSGVGLQGFSERTADAVVDAALGWLERAPERFLLFVHFYDPHAQYRPPPGFAASAPGRPYDGEIAFVDVELKRLLAGLAARWPELDGTLVVLTSDHGESLGEHGERTHSHFVYGATQHIPLLMRGPGVPAGRVVGQVVALRDVAPTVADLLGLGPIPGASGRSLRPLFAKDGSLPERPAYAETLSVHFDWGLSPLFALRDGRHKYVRAPRPELYDLAVDPGETENLVDARPELAGELAQRLAEYLAGQGPVEPNLVPAEEERAALEALGYVVPSGSRGALRLDEMGGEDPKDRVATIARITEADRLLGEGRAGEAMEILDGVEADGLIFHLMVSAAAEALGDGERAEHAARAAVAASPHSPSAYARLGTVLVSRGRVEEAREVYERMQELQPGSGDALTHLGLMEEAGGRAERAARYFREALEVPHPSETAAWRLAALEIEAGRDAEARALLGRVPADVLGGSDAALRLARAELRAGRPDDALRRVSEAVRNHPRNLEARLLQTEVLAEVEPERAREERAVTLELLDRSIALRSADDPSAYLSALRARVLFELGRREEARGALRDAAPWLARLPADERSRALELAAELGVDVPPGS